MVKPRCRGLEPLLYVDLVLKHRRTNAINFSRANQGFQNRSILKLLANAIPKLRWRRDERPTDLSSLVTRHADDVFCRSIDGHSDHPVLVYVYLRM